MIGLWHTRSCNNHKEDNGDKVNHNDKYIDDSKDIVIGIFLHVSKFMQLLKI